MATLAELHQNIRKAIEIADVQRSRRLCESILDARPGNLETLLLLAEVELETGRNNVAVDGFQRVLGGDPEAYLAYAGLAIAHQSLGDSGAAIQYYTRALDLSPANAEIRHERDCLCEAAYPDRSPPPALSEFALARSYLDAGFYPRAVDAHRTAVQREPDRLEAKLGLAESLWMLGGTQEPVDICEEVLGQAPHAVKAHALIACVTAETENLNKGRALLDAVHAQDPDGRIAGYIVGQTPLADWAVESVELPDSTAEIADENQLSADLPIWTGWMRQALWQMLRLVRPSGSPGPDWSILDSGDPVARNRVSPYMPLGRRIRAVSPALAAAASGAERTNASTEASNLMTEVSDDGPSDDDATQIIMRPWPIDGPRRRKGNTDA